jgi:hypothetical protein
MNTTSTLRTTVALEEKYADCLSVENNEHFGRIQLLAPQMFADRGRLSGKTAADLAAKCTDD